ncbi:MAG TPA: MFS transporter [Verrucomicrobiae bacterium]|nr:MFS transporter [Verrucomicrobiae bacterium]
MTGHEPKPKDHVDATSQRLFSDAAARAGFYAIAFGFFLVVLDTTALNVAIGAMQREFGSSVTRLQWVVNSYTMVFASLLLTCGAIGDRFGPRRFYQLGLMLFTGMSLMCALSPGVNFLIGMRVLQGLGAAIMLPASLALLSHAFPHPEERAKAVSNWAAIVSLGFAAGPVLGGVLTNFFGWRSIFWMNVPIGIAALVLVKLFVTEATERNRHHIDWLGQALICTALFCITYALIEAGGEGWTAPKVLIAEGAAILLAIGFLLVEKRSEAPVLPGFLFANATFSVCIAIGVILNFGTYGVLFVESIYLQSARHLNPFHAGMVILPLTLLPTITTRLAVKYAGRKHLKARLVMGQLIAAAGAVVLFFTLRDSGFWTIVAGLALMGVSMGCVMPAITAGVLASSPKENSGVASGILNSARQVGGTLGVAVMGSLYQRSERQGLLTSFGLVLITFVLMAAITWYAMAQRTSENAGPIVETGKRKPA